MLDVRVASLIISSLPNINAIIPPPPSHRPPGQAGFETTAIIPTDAAGIHREDGCWRETTHGKCFDAESALVRIYLGGFARRGNSNGPTAENSDYCVSTSPGVE
ncbi:hypothetical protein JHW43_005937 [Diplocarpon mali]|nr:hypothetical protein JHW43_005937 [Diplocarpon mali]